LIHAVPREKLREEVELLARELMDKSPAALHATKEAIYAVRRLR
jgi:enoyl-CoA hydratase/carnithine racemase